MYFLNIFLSKLCFQPIHSTETMFSNILNYTLFEIMLKFLINNQSTIKFHEINCLETLKQLQIYLGNESSFQITNSEKAK